MIITLTILFVIACGFLGRMGGSGRYPRPLRVVVIPILLTFLSFLHGIHNPIALLVFCGLTTASISTYWDFLFGEDNFYFHGFMLGVSSAALACVSGHWVKFAILVIVTTAYFGLWHILTTWLGNRIKWVSGTTWDESGRYAFLPAVLWLVC